MRDIRLLAERAQHAPVTYLAQHDGRVPKQNAPTCQFRYHCGMVFKVRDVDRFLKSQVSAGLKQSFRTEGELKVALQRVVLYQPLLILVTEVVEGGDGMPTFNGRFSNSPGAEADDQDTHLVR